MSDEYNISTNGSLDLTCTTTIEDVHTMYAAPSRQVTGKVQVNFAGQFTNDALTVTSSGDAYPTEATNIIRNLQQSIEYDTPFKLHDTVLDNTAQLINSQNSYGWISSTVSNLDGTFDTPPWVQLNFSSRLIRALQIRTQNIIEDFNIILTNTSNYSYRVQQRANDSTSIVIEQEYVNIVSIRIEILKITRNDVYTSRQAHILEIPLFSSCTFEAEELFTMDFLEELSYQDTRYALGGISANEINIHFNNTDGRFDKYSLNAANFADQLKRNRRITPYLGIYFPDGSLEWDKLGTFWSYTWEVPKNSLYAAVTAMDTLWLMSTWDYEEHTVLRNQSLYTAIATVLAQFRTFYYADLTWEIDEDLRNIIIPYIVFPKASYMEALKYLVKAYPILVYCNREGTIVATYRAAADEYAKGPALTEQTNIKQAKYPSLYAEVPNCIKVNVYTPMISNNVVLLQDSTGYDMHTGDVLNLPFSATSVGSGSFSASGTAGVYYNIYDWGVRLQCTADGQLDSVEYRGNSISFVQNSQAVWRNEVAIQLDGVRDWLVDSTAVQSWEMGQTIVEHLRTTLTDATIDDIEIEYLGDSALTVNQIVKYLDGTQRNKSYIVTRNELNWNGGLSGRLRLSK